MPELPEVEIVKQSLQKSVILKKIDQVVVNNRNLRLKINKSFEKFFKNKKIINVSRKSKYLILHFLNEKFCIIHLGMSGTLHLLEKKNQSDFTNLSFYHKRNLPHKHNHVEFRYSDFRIIYNDPRRFGYFKIILSQDKLNNFFKKIGPEPLNKNFNYNYLKKKMLNKKTPIKNLLINQKIISGIGNIYASEIMFYSNIHPLKQSSKIKSEDIKKIVKFSKIVLQDAIKKGGSSIRDFKNISGIKGSYQKEFKVYGREKKNCSRKKCKGIIEKIKISNRSTYFCKMCQKI